MIHEHFPFYSRKRGHVVRYTFYFEIDSLSIFSWLDRERENGSDGTFILRACLSTVLKTKSQ